VLQKSRWVVGDGNLIYFWKDNWLGEPLVNSLLLPDQLHSDLDMFVADFITEGQWFVPSYFCRKFPTVVNQILNITLCNMPMSDSLSWVLAPDGVLTNKIAFDTLQGSHPHLAWCNVIWCNFIPPSRSFSFWRFAHSRLPTDDQLRKRGCYVVKIII
jgi:hypothetical protein